MRLVRPDPIERLSPPRDEPDDDWAVTDEESVELGEVFVDLTGTCLPPLRLLNAAASTSYSGSRHHCHHARAVAEIGPLSERVEQLAAKLLAVEEELARLRTGGHREVSHPPVVMDPGRDVDLVRRLRAELPSASDWDDEGSPGYTEEVIERAVGLFGELLRLGRAAKVNVEPPDFAPGPNGSIDLHWVGDRYELLINVPADPRSRPTFYGDNKEDIGIKGALGSDNAAGLDELVGWLRGRV